MTRKRHIILWSSILAVILLVVGAIGLSDGTLKNMPPPEITASPFVRLQEPEPTISADSGAKVPSQPKPVVNIKPKPTEPAQPAPNPPVYLTPSVPFYGPVPSAPLQPLPAPVPAPPVTLPAPESGILEPVTGPLTPITKQLLPPIVPRLVEPLPIIPKLLK